MKNIISTIKSIYQKYENSISTKPLKYVFQFLPKNILLLFLFIITIFIFVPQIIHNDTMIYDNIKRETVVKEIVSKPVSQVIKYQKGKFDKMGIVFATYNRKNTSDYRFELYKNKTIIYKEKFNASILKDIEYHTFKVGTIKMDNTNTYSFKIVPINAKIGNAITMYSSLKGKVINYQLSRTSLFSNFVLIVFIAFLLIFFYINYLVNNKKIKCEKSFLLIALLYIIPITFLIPVYQVPDEIYHFDRAYNLSQYNVLKSPGYNLSNTKMITPSNIDCLHYSRKNSQIENDNILAPNDIFKCYKSTKNQITRNKNINYTSTLVYIPSAIGIKIADTLTNSPMIIFYAGRLANLLVAMSIIMLAFRITPLYKKELLIIGTIPLFIQQLVSYSYDSILNALCFLLIAYVIKFIVQKQNISKRELIIYGFISFLIFEIKLPYGLLSFLILLVDKQKFKTEGKLGTKFKKIFVILFCAIMGYYCVEHINQLGYIYQGVSKPSQVGKQLGYLLSNPLNIIIILLRTFKHMGLWYLQSMVGIIGWLKYQMNNIFIIAFYIMLVLSIMSEKSIINKQKKWIVGIILLIIISGIFAVMYLSWSGYKLPFVDGVQGRYLIPLLLPIVLLFASKKPKIKLSNTCIYHFINIMFIALICTLLIYYY